MYQLNTSLSPNAAHTGLHNLKEEKADLEATYAHLAKLIPQSLSKASTTDISSQMNSIADRIRVINQLIEGRRSSQAGPSDPPAPVPPPPACPLMQHEVDALRALLADGQNMKQRLTDLEEHFSGPITISRFVQNAYSKEKRMGSEDSDTRGRVWYNVLDTSRHIPRHCLYRTIQCKRNRSLWNTLKDISRNACGVQDGKGAYGAHTILPEYEEEHVLDVIRKVETYRAPNNIRNLFTEGSSSQRCKRKRYRSTSWDTAES
ncbi:hypothetical protein HDU81_006709 [Chytriomyces hyalinus]|nr:hypothetical protein HDU81_006709 [Chytriomyces hyalinus]